MIDFISGLIPGSVFVRRYSNGSVWPQIIGLLLMELLPYVIVAHLTNSPFGNVVLGFVLLYSFYEFGYIYNDTVSVKLESAGQTERNAFSKWNKLGFIAGRCIPIVVSSIYVLEHYSQYEIFVLILNLFIIITCFYLHNKLLFVKYRVGTFTFLNLSKIAFRLYVVSETALYYLSSCFPHLIVKLIEYLNAKNLIKIDRDLFNFVKLSVYTSSVLCFVFYDWKIAFVCLPYLLNHCKLQISSQLKAIVRR